MTQSLKKHDIFFILYACYIKKRDIASFMKQFYLKKCFYIKVNCFMKFKNIFSRLKKIKLNDYSEWIWK